MTATSKDRTAEALEQLHAGIATLTSTEEWTAWLDVARHFHTYSFNNTILIWLQRPEGVTRVAGYQAWRKLGRQVRKGERGIRILAPCTYQTEDETTGETRPVIRGFRAVSVFDVAQTDGDPLPEAPGRTLAGDAPGLFRRQLACLIRAEGFRCTEGPMPEGHADANGITAWATHTVTIRDDLTDAQAAKTTAHELAHVLLHNPDHTRPGSREEREIEAESVAYLLCGHAGLNSADYSLGYIAGWAHGDLDAIRATGERVLACAHQVIDRLTTRSDAGTCAA